MTKSVYVLGAGSSVCAGGPLVSGFKEAAIRALDTVEGVGKQRMRAALEHWDKTVPTANVEEYYILVDVLRRLAAKRQTSEQEQIENAKYLISKTLEVAMGTSVSEVHRKFLQDVVLGPKRESAVISLNWDIAYDRALTSESGLWAPDYGYIKAKPTGRGEPNVQQARYELFKLHGSSNWWYCGKCHSLWYVTNKKEVAAYWEGVGRPFCASEKCTGMLVPFMIPPTAQKFESEDFSLPLSEIWRKAREALATTLEVAFVGYSFPPTDVQFKMFAVEALSKNPVLTTIAVVTSPKFGSQRAGFEDRCSEVFSDPRLRGKLRFRYSSFEDWVFNWSGSLDASA